MNIFSELVKAVNMEVNVREVMELDKSYTKAEVLKWGNFEEVSNEKFDEICNKFETEVNIEHLVSPGFTVTEMDVSYYDNSYVVLITIWLDLCDSYDDKSSIKDIPKSTLHYIYDRLGIDMLNDMTDVYELKDRELTKKIKKEIERSRIKDE